MLIQYNNTSNSIKDEFLAENIIEFNYTNDEKIDEYISKKIIPKIKEQEVDAVFIKDSLSDNYLELYGLIVAYHIRLSLELGDKRFMPIVILSDIDGYTLNKLSSLARILFTKSIYLISNTKEGMKNLKAQVLTPLTKETYRKDFLDLINIQSPENSTNHSIANEWAIYRWAEFLKVDSEAIRRNNEKVASMLYFKYLLAKNPNETSKALGYKRPQKSEKILYIDDECKNGWSDIFKKYFSINKEINFRAFGKDFRKSNKFSIISQAIQQCEEYNPDVVLLDLRLTSRDHEEERKIEEFTGIEVLKHIKKLNPGIQVIMFTATSKSLILERLYKYGALGYIKKEHPEDKNSNTKENINKLSELIDEGLEREYLKKVWSITQKLQKLTIFQEEDFKDLEFEINSIFEILDSNMQKRYTYAMLSIFQALEIVNNYYIDDSTKKWRDGYTGVEIKRDGYTKQKINAVLKRLDLFGKFNNEIETISKMRKSAIHPPENRDYDKPTKDNIVNWFTMLQNILEKVADDESNS